MKYIIYSKRAGGWWNASQGSWAGEKQNATRYTTKPRTMRHEELQEVEN